MILLLTGGTITIVLLVLIFYTIRRHRSLVKSNRNYLTTPNVHGIETIYFELNGRMIWNHFVHLYSIYSCNKSTNTSCGQLYAYCCTNQRYYIRLSGLSINILCWFAIIIIDKTINQFLLCDLINLYLHHHFFLFHQFIFPS